MKKKVEAQAAEEANDDNSKTGVVADQIVTAGKPTAEILLAFIEVDKIPNHTQTVEDFGFDRCHSPKDQPELLGVYRAIMTSLDVAPSTVQEWVAESKMAILKNIQSNLRLALEAGGNEPETTDLLKDAFRFFTRNRYIWDSSHMNAETRAIFNAGTAPSFNPDEGDGDIEIAEYHKRMFDSLQKVREDAEAREARGEPRNAPGDHGRPSVFHLKGPDGRSTIPLIFSPGLGLKAFAEEMDNLTIARKVAEKKIAMQVEEEAKKQRDAGLEDGN
ncbi:hypothetical protein CMUS01_04547 [Colletotrichum musicola]|uniref:Uncharacterized protein n=1 Tax=Colletotrichum musicola TaxID=2175873 RepID=A0A8H6KVX2_9PEZI|nr:hypothetical protein CMUS01_04547 [Colletotrichum musicola]